MSGEKKVEGKEKKEHREKNKKKSAVVSPFK